MVASNSYCIVAERRPSSNQAVEGQAGAGADGAGPLWSLNRGRSGCRQARRDNHLHLRSDRLCQRETDRSSSMRLVCLSSSETGRTRWEAPRKEWEAWPITSTF